MQEILEIGQSLAIIIGTLIALITIIQAMREYRRQGRFRRVEFFLDARSRLRSDSDFREIINLLETDDPRLTEISFKKKLHFVGFFEEIALLVNSKVLREQVASYMFGYYALICWNSRNFWICPEKELNKEDPYWAIFRSFVAQVDHADGEPVYEPDSFSL